MGKVKRKGAYEYERQWHQDQSAMIVPRAAEAALLHGVNVEEFILNHDDIYDFMLRAKVPRSSRLVIADRDAEERQIQNTTRYYVSGYGGPMTKIMPPTASQLKKNPDAPERRISICAGRYVTEANDMRNVDRDDIDFNYYIAEAYKLINPLRK